MSGSEPPDINGTAHGRSVWPRQCHAPGLVVEVSGKHTLASLCLALLGAELSIHFAYPLMTGRGGDPAIALAVDDITLAGQLLRRKEFRLLGEADLIADGKSS